MLGFKPNRIVKFLIVSDLIFWTGWGFINPIFAIFIIERIEDGSALVAGIASGIYWVLTSILRIPIGIMLDKGKGEKDDYLVLTAGLLVAALVPLGFIFSKFAWHIYLLQSIYAVGMAMALSGWQAIFTRHIDKGKEATEWGIDATSVGFGMGIAGILGGLIVTMSGGFEIVFIAAEILGLLGVVALFKIKDEFNGSFDKGFYFSLKDIFNREQ